MSDAAKGYKIFGSECVFANCLEESNSKKPKKRPQTDKHPQLDSNKTEVAFAKQNAAKQPK